MPRIKPLFSGVLIVAGIAVLSAGGHWAGQKAARAGLFPDAKRTSSGDHAPAAPIPPRPRPAAVRQDHLAAALKRLKTVIDGCPDFSIDWEASATVDEILADLSAEELAGVYAEINPATDSVLARKVGACWMAKDPDAAMAAMLAKTPGNPLKAIQVFGEWAQNQPAAALAWLESPGFPAGLAESKDTLYSNTVSGLLQQDYELATGTLKKMSPEASAQVMESWGYFCANDPAMRDRLVDFVKGTGRPQDYATLNAQMVRSWPQEDSAGMMNYLIGLKGYLETEAVPAAARPQVDAMAVSAAIDREYDRPALEWWMERYSGSAEVPGALANAFSGWAQKYPDKVEQWFAEQPASPQLDGLRSSMVPGLANAGNFNTAAGNIAAISDSTLRQQATERLDFIWSASDPDAAAKWRATLPGK